MSDDSGRSETTATLLFVDDESNILTALRRLFRPHGYRILLAESGEKGLETLERETVDLVISDMRMPQMDGAQFLEKVRDRWPWVVRILLTGYADVSSTIAAINRGEIYRYIAKPWEDDDMILVVRQALEWKTLERENTRLLELTRRQNNELAALNASLETKVAERTAELRQANVDLHKTFISTVQVFSSLIELRGGRLGGHSRRVAELARQIGERLGLEESEQRNVLIAGLLHDIGKLGLPDKLLDRPLNALSQAEKNEFARHPIRAQQLLSGVPQLKEVARVIRHQRESMDGGGYPDGIGGLMIPLGARILAVANDYDELLSGQMTLQPQSPKEAQTQIQQQRGKRYDPIVIAAFSALLNETEAQQGTEVAVTTDKLRPGMVLARDFDPGGGLPPLVKGRVLDAALVAQLNGLRDATGEPPTLYVWSHASPGVMRDPGARPVRRQFKEIALQSQQLAAGMMLSRSLYHTDGYLLLARGNRLDDLIIKQIMEFERAGDSKYMLYIQSEDA